MPNYCVNLNDVIAASNRIRGRVHCTPLLTCSAINRLAAEKHSLFSSSTTSSAATTNNEEEEKLQRDGNNGKSSLSSPRCQSFFFKVEAMQRTGSFKFRGALNAILSVLENGTDDDNNDDGDGDDVVNVVTHSSGNHAQALALAASVASDVDVRGDPRHRRRRRRVHATIVMPNNAPDVKQRAVSGYGADIVLVASTNEARELGAEKIRKETGAVFIHPSENPNVIAGQGTVSLEMVKQVGDLLQVRKEEEEKQWGGDNEGRQVCGLDAVIIPVGGGGLASGNTVALRGLLGDKVKIILAEPKELDDAKRSKDASKLMGHREDNKLNSIADGLKTTLGPNTWPIVRDLVDDIITVSEEDILRATKLVWERMKVCVEPSSGVGVAVALSREFAERYRVEDGIVNVGVILCGGNVDIVKLAKMMDKLE